MKSFTERNIYRVETLRRKAYGKADARKVKNRIAQDAFERAKIMKDYLHSSQSLLASIGL